MFSKLSDVNTTYLILKFSKKNTKETSSFLDENIKFPEAFVCASKPPF